MDTKQPEALRLADTLDLLAMDMKTPRMAATELRRQHAEIETLRAGYSAARLEIESLKERVQQLGQLARDVNSRRVVELEAQLAAVGAGGVEPLRKRPVFGLPGTRDVDVAAAQKAWDAAQAQPAQAGEREAFEAWVAASGRAHMLKRDDRNDWYADLTVTAWWTAWQASAARGAAQAAPHVGESRFESWYAQECDKGWGTQKQLARDAYAAGMGDSAAHAAPVDAAKDLHDEIMRLAPTDADIIALADETRTGEPGRDGYILPISFAHAVLAKWGTPAPASQPVAAPAAGE